MARPGGGRRRIEPPTSTELAEYDHRGVAGAPSLAGGLRQPVSLDRLVEDEVVEGFSAPDPVGPGAALIDANLSRTDKTQPYSGASIRISERAGGYPKGDLKL